MPRSALLSTRFSVQRSAPMCPDHFEAGRNRAAFFHHGHLGHARIRRPVGAQLQHLIDLVGRARETASTTPSLVLRTVPSRLERPRGLVGPGAIIDTMHPAFDLHRDGLVVLVCRHRTRSSL